MSNQQENASATNDSSLLGQSGAHAALSLSPLAVVLAAALLLANAAISVKFSLGWHKSLTVACLRCCISAKQRLSHYFPQWAGSLAMQRVGAVMLVCVTQGNVRFMQVRHTIDCSRVYPGPHLQPGCMVAGHSVCLCRDGCRIPGSCLTSCCLLQGKPI